MKHRVDLVGHGGHGKPWHTRDAVRAVDVDRALPRRQRKSRAAAACHFEAKHAGVVDENVQPAVKPVNSPKPSVTEDSLETSNTTAEAVNPALSNSSTVAFALSTLLSPRMTLALLRQTLRDRTPQSLGTAVTRPMRCAGA